MERLFFLEVGRRIKQKRVEQGLTIEELAANSKVNVDQLSEIEEGSISIPLPTLFRVAYFLKIKWSDIFLDTDTLRSRVVHSRKADYTSFQSEDFDGLNNLRMMMGSMPASTIDFVLMNITENSCHGEIATKAFEFIFVLNGQTHYVVNGLNYYLEEGDSLFFDGRLSHAPNKNSIPCTLLVLYFTNSESGLMA